MTIDKDPKDENRLHIYNFGTKDPEAVAKLVKAREITIRGAFHEERQHDCYLEEVVTAISTEGNLINKINLRAVSEKEIADKSYLEGLVPGLIHPNNNVSCIYFLFSISHGDKVDIRKLMVKLLKSPNFKANVKWWYIPKDIQQKMEMMDKRRKLCWGKPLQRLCWEVLMDVNADTVNLPLPVVRECLSEYGCWGNQDQYLIREKTRHVLTLLDETTVKDARISSVINLLLFRWRDYWE